MSCNKSQQCKDEKYARERRYSIPESLYDSGIDDNIRAAWQCYPNNKVEYVEEFGCQNNKLWKMLRLLAIIGLIIFILNQIFGGGLLERGRGYGRRPDILSIDIPDMSDTTPDLMRTPNLTELLGDRARYGFA